MNKFKSSYSIRRVETELINASFECSIKELEQTARTAEDAANSLNVNQGSIVKTLVFWTDDCKEKKPVISLIAGDRICNTEELKKEINHNGALTKMEAGDVKKVTGFTIGGVSPVGLINPIPIVVDDSIFRFERVWCAAGHPFFVFSISPRDLVSITSGKVSNKVGISNNF